MLSSVARSTYICQQCRSRLLRSRRPAAFTTSPLPPHALRFISYKPPNRPARQERDHDWKDTLERDYDQHGEQEKDHGRSDLQERDISHHTANPRRFNSPSKGSAVDFSIAELLSASAKRAQQRQSAQTFRDEAGGQHGRPKAPMSKPANQWEAVGLRPAVAETLLRAFPAVNRMTEHQRQILQPLIKGHSVVAYSQAGSGKTFAITAWLLTLVRSARTIKFGPNIKSRTELTTTALIIVPNSELAQQYLANITYLLEATGSKAVMENPAAFVQALYRGAGFKEREEQLKANRTPHILIATPEALLEVLSSKTPEVRELVDYQSLKAIVIEEADKALSRYENPIKGAHTAVDPETVKDPLLILLDYIFKARKVYRLKAGEKLCQPQLVIPSSATGSARVKRIIDAYHPIWIDGENRPGFTPFTGKGITSVASQLVVVGEGLYINQSSTKSLPLKVPDNLTHHIVAYDPATGFVRDAPVPSYDDVASVTADMKASEAHQLQVELSLQAAISSNATGKLNPLIKSYGNLAPEVKRRGYPANISAEVLETLLNHDHWPRNVFAVIGENSSRLQLQSECAKRGINARLFELDTWNSNAEEEGRAPIGRLDMTLSSHSQPSPPSGSRENTTVWIANYPSLRGLDIPGISHLYILHRLDRVREYVTYAGRVARWPFSKEECLRDPRFMGRDPRPQGKVVSVLLEERGNHADEVGENDYSFVLADGSEAEEWVWKNEGLRLAKIGIQVKKYFGHGDKTAEGNAGYGDLGEVLRRRDEEVEMEMEMETEVNEGPEDEHVPLEDEHVPLEDRK
jgi:hypothetical protein